MRIENPDDNRSRAAKIVDELSKLGKGDIAASVDETDSMTIDDIEVKQAWNRVKRWTINAGYTIVLISSFALLLAFLILLFHFVNDTITGGRVREVFSNIMIFIFGAIASAVFQQYIARRQGGR